MKVFISWSGEQSRKYGEAIRDWLPVVLQMVTPYFTPADIEKGTRWSTDIAKELESSQVGILCVTRDNLHSDWILFEAGALSKSLEKSHVCPVIFDISNTDLSGPLKQFQTTEFEKSDFHKLISVINSKLGEHKLSPKTLDTVFDKWWPDLEMRVKTIASSVTEPMAPVRSERELIEEILTLTRANSRSPERAGLSSKAILSIIETHNELHDNQAAEEGGYQDVLNILQKVQKPLAYVADKYKGSSSVMDKAIDKLGELSYKSRSYEPEDSDDEIPF